VDEPILKGLGLNPIDKVKSGTAAGQAEQWVYMARLSFPQLGWTIDLPVAGVDLAGVVSSTTPPEPIGALLGRNLLGLGVLVWNGPGGTYTLAW
jgi:hypothetical protein